MRFQFQTGALVVFAAILGMSCSGIAQSQADCPSGQSGALAVQAVYTPNSGSPVSLNPGAAPNFCNTSPPFPLINPCPGNSGYAGTGCQEPISSGQWPMPHLTFSVLGLDPTQGYEVHWTLNMEFSDLAHNAVTSQVQAVTSGTPAQLGWTPSWSGPSGGRLNVEAVVTAQNACATPGSPTGYLTFFVRGANPDPGLLGYEVAQKIPSVFTNTALTPSPGWFLPYLIERESGGRQFNSSNGIFEDCCPDGIGLTQVDRTRQPGYFSSSNPAPYWDFTVNLTDGLKVLLGLQQSTASPCNTGAGEVGQTFCEQFAYDFWDRQVYQACIASPGGSASPSRAGPPGTEVCNVPIPPVPAYSGPDVGNCLSAFSWSTSNPGQHFQDLDWINDYNGVPCGYFVYWDEASKAWKFHAENACVPPGSTTSFPNYVLNVCNSSNHAAY